MTFVLIIVLISNAGAPVMTTQEFSSQATCERAKETIREATRSQVDVLKCVPK